MLEDPTTLDSESEALLVSDVDIDPAGASELTLVGTLSFGAVTDDEEPSAVVAARLVDTASDD